MIGNDKLQKLLDSTPQLCMLQVVEVQQGYGELYSLQPEEWESGENEQLRALLQQYSDVFKDPTCLPSKRGVFDHRILLE